MSKPFILATYPKDPNYDHDDAFTVYLMPNGGKQCAGTACALPASKRFTDAELAAEYHKQGHVFMLNGGAKAPNALEQAQIWDTFYRFATLPHHDETPGLTAHQEGTR